MNITDTPSPSFFQRYSFVTSIIAGLVCGAGGAYVTNIGDTESVHAPLTTESSVIVDLKPSPKWTPSEVVTIQLDALEFAAKDPKGFECCYRFASPSNVRAIGSLERFTELVQEAYGTLIGSSSRLLGREMISNNHATVLVSCVGRDSSVTCFRFLLSKQQDGENKDCWLTDSVIIITDNSPQKPNESNDPALEISSIN